MIKKTIKHTCVFIFTGIFLLLIFFGGTNIGLKMLVDSASKIMPGKLHVQIREGALSRAIYLQSLTYENDTTHLTIEHARLKFNLLQLLLGKLEVTTLKIKQFDLTIKPAEKKTKSTKTPQLILPIKILLPDVDIKQLTYQAGKQPLVLHDFNLQAELQTNKLRIDNLQSSWQGATYQAQGLLTIDPIYLKLNFTKHVDKKVALHTVISATGNWQHITLTANMDVPVVAETTLDITDLLTTPSWTLSGNIKNFPLLQQQPETLMTTAFNGSGTTQKFNLTTTITPVVNEANTNIQLSLASDNLTANYFTGTVQWHNIITPDKNHTTLIPDGNLNLTGNLTRYTVNGQTTMRGKNVPNSIITVAGTGTLSSLDLTQISINTLGGIITGNAKFDWSKQLSYTANFAATHLQPNLKWRDWPGDVSFAMNIYNQNDGIAFKINQLSGHLNRQPLQGTVNIVLAKQQLNSAMVNIQAGKALINMVAINNGNLNLTWQVDIPDLTKLLYNTQGHIQTAGNLQQNGKFFHISGSILLHQMNWQQFQLDNLTTQFNVNTDPQQLTQLILDVNNIKLNNYQFTHFSVNMSGKNPQHKIDLQLANDGNLLTAQIIANFAPDLYTFEFKKFDLHSNNFGNWSSPHAFQFLYSPDALKLQDFAWNSRQQNFTASFATEKNYLTSANIHVHNLSLNLFNFFLPLNIRLSGLLNLQSNYQLNNNIANGKFAVNLINSKMDYQIKQQAEQLTINQGTLQAAIKNNHLTSTLKLNVNQNQYFDLDFNIPNFDPKQPFTSKQILQGNLSSKINSLNFLKPFISVADNLDGQFAANFSWNGTIKQPNLIGTAAINNAELKIPQQGLDIKQIALNANAANQHVAYSLAANSGQGNLKITGDSYLTSDYHTDLTIQGENFEFDNTPAFYLVVSPNLTVNIIKSRINLKGTLLLPEATINLKGYDNVVTLSPDVQVIASEGKQTNNSWLNNFYARINLQLGDQVHLITKYLTARLTGSINLTDNPHTSTTATGELTINHGTFTAFGQQLNITNGKLIYAGGIAANPGLNIKATKEIKTFVNPAANSITQTSSSSSSTPSPAMNVPLQALTITVGVSVSNTLQQPDIVLFSDQGNLSQADILSYLILGYPLSQANNQQGEALVQAANALSASNTEMSGVISKIRDTFNLNQIGLQTNNYLNPNNNTVIQNTSLLLGKMLSPHLLVSYSIGLIAPINTLSSSYSFTKNWSVQAQTNNLGSGGDLIYSWETN